MNQRYEVVWDDAHGDTVMFTAEEMDHKPYKFTTLGYLIKSDEVGISLAHEYGQDGKFRDHTFIPRAMVISEAAVCVDKPKRVRKPKVTPADVKGPLLTMAEEAFDRAHGLVK